MNSNETTPDDKALIKVDQDDIHGELPILPLNNLVAFPTLNMALAVPEQSFLVIEAAMKGNRLIGIVGTKSQVDNLPVPGQMYEMGTVVRALYVTRAPDNSVLLVVHGLKRFRVTEWISGNDFLRAKIELTPETIESDIEMRLARRPCASWPVWRRCQPVSPVGGISNG